MDDPVAPIGPSIALQVYGTWGAIALLAIAVLATVIVVVRRRCRRDINPSTPPDPG